VKHFPASWLDWHRTTTLLGGKVLLRTRRCAVARIRHFCQAAQSVAINPPACGVLPRGFARPWPQAGTAATAHKTARTVYHLLKTGEPNIGRKVQRSMITNGGSVSEAAGTARAQKLAIASPPCQRGHPRVTIRKVGVQAVLSTPGWPGDKRWCVFASALEARCRRLLLQCAFIANHCSMSGIPRHLKHDKSPRI